MVIKINQALQSENPFDIVPSRDEIGHGTMMAGIICGNDVPEQGFYGIVPDAELVVVKLKQAKPYLKEFWRIRKDAICYQDNDIVFALEYLEQIAIRLNRPMTVCVALGTSLAPHDGRTSYVKELSVRSENLNFAFLVAAGNEGNAKRHYFSIINQALGSDKVELNVGDGEEGFTMQVWGDSPGLFSIDVTTPSGEYISRFVPILNDFQQVNFIFERTTILIDYQLVESQSGDQLILFRFTNPTPGIWRFNVYGRGDLPLGFHIWLPMEGFISENTYFLKPNPDTTLISAANGGGVITITAYDPKDESIYTNASRGYTRVGAIKPDVAAPGVRIVSPTINHQFAEVSGTSAATAHATGVAAMILEWGIVKGNLPFINTEDVKILMLRGARRDSTLQYPNRIWGYGILDIYNIFDSFRRR
jgi:subtilisin family serine protease